MVSPTIVLFWLFLLAHASPLCLVSVADALLLPCLSRHMLGSCWSLFSDTYFVADAFFAAKVVMVLVELGCKLCYQRLLGLSFSKCLAADFCRRYSHIVSLGWMHCHHGYSFYVGNGCVDVFLFSHVQFV